MDIQAILAAPPARPDATPEQQPWHGIDNTGQWQLRTSADLLASSHPITSLHLITWNIDVLIPCGRPRMQRALSYLNSLLAHPSPTSARAYVILLQEMSHDDMETIKQAPWVQQRFYLSDADGSRWPDRKYGAVTLLDRRLVLDHVFRVPFASRFGRDALFVDILLPPAGRDHGHGDEAVRVRLCNVHLESLVAEPPLRPEQVATASVFMREHGVNGAVMAGDFNAIERLDRSLAEENGLGDAYLEIGGLEDEEEGHTWGYQSKAGERERFGCSRMDKTLFCGQLKVSRLQRIGVGVCVEDEKAVAEMGAKGMSTWMTDHYGLMADLEIAPLECKVDRLGRRM